MEILEIEDKKIEYILERKKIKNCYISVKNGIVTVRAPKRLSKENIEEILLKRKEWIFENIEKQKNKVNTPKMYTDGEKFKVLGKDVILNISYEKIKKPKIKFRFNKLNVILPNNLRENEKEETEKLVEQFYNKLAEKEIEKAMRKMSMKVGFAPNQYKVKNLKSTWGNCSISGNISINKKVVMYSRHAIEYVCLHEICHLQNMNHSKDFWNMVEKFMPDYQEAEKELKD